MKEKIQNINPNDLDYVKKMMQMANSGPRTIETPEVVLKKNGLEQAKTIQNQIRQFEKGYESLVAEMQQQAVEGTVESGDEGEKITIEQCLLNEEKKKKLFDPVEWEKSVNQEMELNEICSFSEKALLTLYQIALGLHTKALYEESSNAFYFLCKVAPRVSSFWVGLGLALESKQDYPHSIEAFEQAFKVNPADFTPFYGMIRCCQQFKDYGRVKELLEQQKENPETKNEVEEALVYIQSLERPGGQS